MVQGLGSVAAILVAVAVAWWQNRQVVSMLEIERKRTKTETVALEAERLVNVFHPSVACLRALNLGIENGELNEVTMKLLKNHLETNIRMLESLTFQQLPWIPVANATVDLRQYLQNAVGVVEIALERHAYTLPEGLFKSATEAAELHLATVNGICRRYSASVDEALTDALAREQK